MHITNNPLYHERTKHIEANWHFIREVMMKGEVYTPYIKSIKQLEDLFTKALPNVIISYHYSKLGMQNVFVPTLGEMLGNICMLNMCFFFVFLFPFLRTI